MHCTRVENHELGSVDFVDNKGVVRLPLSLSATSQVNVLTTVNFQDRRSQTLTDTSCPHPRPAQLLLRTLASERERTVLQIGTSAPDLALAAASVAASEVAAIDVNMGCPVAFSVSGGMGSALLEKPETVREILTTLRRCAG